MEETKISMKKERVVVYIDGFNLYFGIKEAGFEQCKWLDLKQLATNLLQDNQELIEIKYFTSRVCNNPDKQKRQSTYLEAIDVTGVKIYYGHYQAAKIECKICGSVWCTYNEKMTDVNIATHIIVDAYQDKYDMAMLISGDSDLVPPINAVHEFFKNKRIFVAFPPKRHNKSIALVAKGSMIIGRKKLIDSQLPDEFAKKDGFVLKKPNEWHS